MHKVKLPNGDEVDVIDYVNNVSRYLLPAASDDVAQDALLLFLKKQNQFNGKNAASFKTWLWRVCHSAAMYYRRKLRKSLPLPNKVYAPYLDPAQSLIIKERDQRIKEAIAKLPDDYRATFAMAVIDEVPDKEVAEKLSISLPCVKSRIHRSKLLLRKILS